MTNTIYTYKNFSFKNTVITTILFFIIRFIGVYYHELWMDESHHFLLGRDSTRFLDLYKNTRYDGHSILWNYLVHLVTIQSANPFYMQLMPIIISTIIAFIYLKKAPFKIWFKIAFLLSYFMFYEYIIISKNYNLGVLFLSLSCVLYSQREENFFIFCTFLALSCKTHSIFTIVTLPLLFSVFLELFPKNKKEILMLYWKEYLVFFIGIGIAFYQIIPPSDSLFFDNINYLNLFEAFKSSMSFFKALFPVVDFTTVKYWNHFYFIEHFKVISLIIGAVVWILPLLFFNKNRYVLIFINTTLIGFIAFEIASRRYGTGYNGLLIVTLICAFWLLNSKKEKTFLNKKFSKLNTKIIFLLMLVQASFGILGYSLDLKYTFNHRENAANFIKEKKLYLNSIITVCENASINAFLAENLYSLAYQRPQGYYPWSKNVQLFYNHSDAQPIALSFDKKIQNNLYFINQLNQMFYYLKGLQNNLDKKF